jgi:hypothetical protein
VGQSGWVRTGRRLLSSCEKRSNLASNAFDRVAIAPDEIDAEQGDECHLDRLCQVRRRVEDRVDQPGGNRSRGVARQPNAD